MKYRTQTGFIGFFARFFRPETDAWRGRQPLTTVFWGYGVATSFALIILHAAALVRGRLLSQQALIVISAAYTFWILVSLWRCSANVKSCWGGIARGLTVAWAFNAAMVLIFLQLDLVIRILRA